MGSGRRICVIGSGTRFLSGISYDTIKLANGLASSNQVSVILMRRLLPTCFYPGKSRVGANLTSLEYDPAVRVFDGVDWFWLPSIFRAIAFFVDQRPEVVVFQWWTGTVAHSYLALAVAARMIGARIVIEFHEVLDTAEARMFLVRTYIGLMAPLLVRLASAFVIHAQYHELPLEKTYRTGNRPVVVIPLGSHHGGQGTRQINRPAPASCCNFLYLGVIRPYKGVDDLIRAFDTIPEEEIERYWLTIVGETWEDWGVPSQLIESSRYRDRITFVNRYVRDEEVVGFFAGADAVVLPYHRSVASGSLRTGMSHGLPVVVTSVGGLLEAVSDYEGAVLVPPCDPDALREGMAQALTMRGKHFADPSSWEHSLWTYNNLLTSVVGDQLLASTW